MRTTVLLWVALAFLGLQQAASIRTRSQVKVAEALVDSLAAAAQALPATDLAEMLNFVPPQLPNLPPINPSPPDYMGGLEWLSTIGVAYGTGWLSSQWYSRSHWKEAQENFKVCTNIELLISGYIIGMHGIDGGLFRLTFHVLIFFFRTTFKRHSSGLLSTTKKCYSRQIRSTSSLLSLSSLTKACGRRRRCP